MDHIPQSLVNTLPDMLVDKLPGIHKVDTLDWHAATDGIHESALTCWLLDTRNLWPGSHITQAAPELLDLISEPERKVCSTKMWIADAKMSLGSALLKRLYISQTLGIPWHEVRFGKKGNPKHGKPCAYDKEGKIILGIDFNVSHQAGLVALIGWDGRKHKNQSYNANGTANAPMKDGMVHVGTDIVCVNERDDYRTIDAEGFDSWVDVYEEIFSEEERWDMKYNVDYVTLLDGTTLSSDEVGRGDRCMRRYGDLTATRRNGTKVTFGSDLLIEAKLRRFYTFFSYKESYIKVVGEGLLASWLKQLEFLNVRSPKPGTVARCSTHGTWGEIVDDVEVHMYNQKVEDIKMQIQSFEEDFMISTAIKGEIEQSEIPTFKKLNLEHDVLAHAPL